MKKQKNNNKSFTLIELIVVLAIISILVTILIATIKPTEIFKKSRDSKRIADLKNIEKTIDLLYSTYPNFNELNYASTNIVYISLKDTSATCANWINDLSSLPSGYEYRCSANPQNIDGTGWIPIPFNSFDIINIANLPIDPINKPPYYYTFVVGGSYALYTMLEDPKNIASKNDNDNYPHLYSVGTNKRLIDQAQGLVGYWPFDEGTETIAYDYSGNNNHGTLYNGPQWVDGKVGKALSFDGVDDKVEVPDSPSLDIRKNLTIMAWVYPRTQLASIGDIVRKGRSYILGWVDRGSDVFACWIYDTAWRQFRFSKPYSYYIGKWWYFVLTYDGSYVKLYVNGILDREYNYVSTINISTYSLGIGWGSPEYSGEFFNGLIDEVRIYNRALSDAEIKALYEATK